MLYPIELRAPIGPGSPASPTTDSHQGYVARGGTYSKPDKECKVLEASRSVWPERTQMAGPTTLARGLPG